jgi:hypothetical protein
LEKHVVGEESKRCDGTPHSAVVEGDLELVESPLWMGVVRVWWCGGGDVVSGSSSGDGDGDGGSRRSGGGSV